MAWQFLTPVMYSLADVPTQIVPAFLCNPMSSIIIAYRDILYYKQAPKAETLIQAFLFGIALLVIGWSVFGKLKRRFAEEL